MALNLNDTELTAVVEQLNVAEQMSEEALQTLGQDVTSDYLMDEQSRADWMDQNSEWMNLAAQLKEIKNHPWMGSSNIKYPLLTMAAVQFHARAQQALLKGARPVQVKVIGRDPDGAKRARGERVSEVMSYQLLHQMSEWADDMDRLLFLLPIVGVCFKKTYYSSARAMNISELVLPQDLAINYYAKDFGRARKTHRLYKDHNEIVELQRTGLYLDIDIGMPIMPLVDADADKREGQQPLASFEDYPHTLLEVHGWWDLDEDGYKEPWIVTVDNDSQKVVRVTPRFTKEGVTFLSAKKIAKIDPVEYFTKYTFLPSFSSKIYGMGFGMILGPLNAGVNTLINQLIDGGTLANLPSGFLGRGIRLSRGGPATFRPGQWQSVHSTGDDLRKGIFPLPVKEPSPVLLNLLGLVIQSGEKVGSINEALLGENPGQNQPYSTTAAVLEQGLKVFVGIYKRIYRALTKEYENLYRLNSIYLTDDVYSGILDRNPESEGEVSVATDFEKGQYDIVPGADPDIASETQRLIKSESLLNKIAAGMPLNVTEALRRVLEAEGQENIEALMNVEPPPPDPKTVLNEKELEHRIKYEWARLEFEANKAEFEAAKDRAQAISLMAKAQATLDDTEIKKLTAQAAVESKVMDQLMAKQKNLAEFVTAQRELEEQKRANNLRASRPSGGEGAPAS